MVVTGWNPVVAEGVGSCTLSDACDELRMPAVRTGVLRPSWNGCPTVAGPVATLTLRPAATPDPDPLPAIVHALAEMGGFVVLVDLGGRQHVQCWGGVLAVVAQRFGVRGTLVDGAVRDVNVLEEIGFPVFARAVHPARIRGRLELAAVDDDVVIDGGIVQAGDMVVVDTDGALFLPLDSAADAVELARVREAEEQELLARLRAGADPRDVFDAA
jgi:4-hydroxy-4-methyl-2-oxoglutarate aldolase